jgi:hypothetical protein
MLDQMGEAMADDPTMARLEDQINWYDKSAGRSQFFFKAGKIIVIVSAALIPFISGMKELPTWYTGALGVLIAIVEGLQQLNQYHSNWTSYRSTSEALKHEKYLFLANAGAYAQAADPRALLAERVEALVSQETTKWATTQETSDKKPAPAAANKAGV